MISLLLGFLFTSLLLVSLHLCELLVLLAKGEGVSVVVADSLAGVGEKWFF